MNASVPVAVHRDSLVVDAVHEQLLPVTLCREGHIVDAVHEGPAPVALRRERVRSRCSTP